MRVRKWYVQHRTLRGVWRREGPTMTDKREALALLDECRKMCPTLGFRIRSYLAPSD